MTSERRIMSSHTLTPASVRAARRGFTWVTALISLFANPDAIALADGAVEVGHTDINSPDPGALNPFGARKLRPEPDSRTPVLTASTQRRRHLDKNVAATEIKPTDDDMRRLDEPAPPGVTASDRSPDVTTVASRAVRQLPPPGCVFLRRA